MILLFGLPRRIYLNHGIFDIIRKLIGNIITASTTISSCITLYCAIAMIVFTFVKIKIAKRIKLALPIAIFLATTTKLLMLIYRSYSRYYFYGLIILIVSEIASVIAIVSCFKTKKLESSEQNISE